MGKVPSAPYIFPMSPSDFSKTLNLFLDFHRNYLFRVMFFEGSLGNVLDIAQATIMTYLVSETATPISRTESTRIGWQGSYVKIAEKTEFQDWKVTIRDDHLNIANSYFQNWRDQIYNYKTGNSVSISDSILKSYKKSALIILLASGDVTDAVVGTKSYIINGIWPKEVGEVSLSYGTESIIQFPVTFSVDWYSPFSITDTINNIL